MKTLKQHIKDKEYDDFEEDLMAEKVRLILLTQ